MSVPKQYGQQTLFDAPVAMDGLFGATDRYRLFHERIMPVLWGKRNELAKLYCGDNGRAAIEPVHMAGMTVLQYMENKPDRQATEAMRLNLGWKFGLGIPLDHEGIHPTSLVVFRKRLLEAGLDTLVFDAVVEVLQEAGLVKRRDLSARLPAVLLLWRVLWLWRTPLLRGGHAVSLSC